MPIQGNIEEAGLPDVLQLLSLGRKTGCLALADGALQGEIFLDVGRISYATVANRLDRLGEMLVKNGRITQQQLDAAIAQQSRPSKRQLGRILVDSGRIDRAELERFIRMQVEEAVYFLFTWKQGTFAFTADRLPPHQPLLVSLDAEALLLEGARRVDEWSLIQKKIPSFELVYRRTREKLGAAADGLTDVQKRLLPLIDGECNVAGLVDDTGLGEFDVGKALYGLLTAGLIQMVERREHIRHLEYRELLAYSVKEAEFADPQRRKAAARHIVDCAACADRLRTIQVQRPTQPQPAEEAQTAAAARPKQAPALVGPDEGAGPPRIVERRRTDRRAGRDRRQFDRRTGYDRRQASGVRAASGAASRPARREGDRRTVARERLGAAFVAEQAEPAASVAAPNLAEPRVVSLPDLIDESEVQTAAPASPAAGATAPERGALQPEAQGGETGAGAPPADMVAAEGPPSLEPAVSPTPSPGPPGELSWLVTPTESLEMLRAARTGLRPAPAKAGAAPDVPPAVPRVPPRPDITRGPGREPHVVPPSRRKAFPVRGFTMAAALAGIAFVGYVAGQLGRSPSAAGAPPAAHEMASSRIASPQPARTPAKPDGAELSGAAASRLLATAQPTGGVERARSEAPAPASGPGEHAAVRTQPPAHTARPPRPAPTGVVPSSPPSRAEMAGATTTPPAPPQPVPTVGTVRGVVKDATGQAIGGAKVSVRGTALSAVADASGTFEIAGVPGGPATLVASADGYVAGSSAVQAQAGATVTASFTLVRPAAAVAPDSELAAGGWIRIERTEALSALGGTFGVLPGLPIESVAQSAAGSRPRIRVAQLTAAGERIVLTETRAGADVRGAPGAAVVTALRVMPPSEAYPWSTGTVSFGNILITAKTHLGADALRSYLGRLSEAPQAP